MLHTIGWFIEMALEVAAVVIGIELFILIIRPKTRKRIISAIDEVTKAVYNWIHEKMSDKKDEPAEEETEDEGRVTIEMTYSEFKEFERAMKNGKPFDLK